MLKEVRIKAAQQRSILEKSLEKSGHVLQPVRVEESESASKDSEPPSSALIDRQQDKAQALKVLSSVQVKHRILRIFGFFGTVTN